MMRAPERNVRVCTVAASLESASAYLSSTVQTVGSLTVQNLRVCLRMCWWTRATSHVSLPLEVELDFSDSETTARSTRFRMVRLAVFTKGQPGWDPYE